MGIQALLSDPLGYLRQILLMLPGILPALILHECAHGWVAYKLGDPTAKMLGRLSLDPRKHLDPLGTLSMVLLGLGWAKPVPINPRNFKHPRRDDFLVSIAGVTANCLMFLAGYFVLMLVYYRHWSAIRVTNSVANLLYQMLANFAAINLGLMVFNLIPVPPLDGFHVLNDVILGRSPFASGQIAQIGRVALLVLLWTGVLGSAMSVVENWIMDAVGGAYFSFFQFAGII
ncbi:MAG: site-2 protease family protein [Clostridia bacterium]|nr:site-2 protease family protein [Clostridia bacterium]